MMNDFELKFKEINEVLIEYGWVISPYMIGRDFENVYSLVLAIKKQTSPTIVQKEKFSIQINEVLTEVIFHPLFRAFFVYRAKELKHLSHVSHHIERAILHYYNQDYFSGVHCLLPAIESALLSYYGWTFGDLRKPNINLLIKEIEKCKAPTTHNPSYYKMYSGIIVMFLKKWIFSETSTTDTTFSYLNRHYVLHGMGTGNYYSLADFHRMIMFFDLLTEFLSLEQLINYNFTPEDNDLINRRRDYYFSLIEKNPKRNEMLEKEKEFIKENSNYFPEEKIPSWNSLLVKFMKEHWELFLRAKILRAKK